MLPFHDIANLLPQLAPSLNLTTGPALASPQNRIPRSLHWELFVIGGDRKKKGKGQSFQSVATTPVFIFAPTYYLGNGQGETTFLKVSFLNECFKIEGVRNILGSILLKLNCCCNKLPYSGCIWIKQAAIYKFLSKVHSSSIPTDNRFLCSFLPLPCSNLSSLLLLFPFQSCHRHRPSCGHALSPSSLLFALLVQ